MKSLRNAMLSGLAIGVLVVTSACAVAVPGPAPASGQGVTAASAAPRLYESEVIREAVAAHQAAETALAAAPDTLTHSGAAPRLYESEVIREAVAAHQTAVPAHQATEPVQTAANQTIARQPAAGPETPNPGEAIAAAVDQRMARPEAARMLAQTGLYATGASLARVPAVLPAAGAVRRRGDISERIEPGAGQWQTWVLASGSQLRPPAPPDNAATASEIQALKTMAAGRDADALQQIAYWDAGSPAYRWVEIALNQFQAKPLSNPRILRGMALMNVAVYDALVAAWDAKYTYNRPRPSEFDSSLVAVVANPRSPSYPSEHAVVAGAASTILAYLYPDAAQSFVDKAQQAAQSRLLAGVQYPSDVQAGLDLGRAVAQKVIERARADGSDAKWTGAVPTGPGLWNGTNPIEPLAGTWGTWVLRSGSELRPPAPPAYDSPQKLADLAEIKAFTRTFTTNATAMYWQTFDGVFRTWYDTASLRLFEHRLDQDAPLAARAYAAMSVAHYDAIVACWDAKYAYWAIRPFQLDPAVVTLFLTPNHPSYPAAHGCASGAISGVLEYLFPDEAGAIHARADQAATSRMWAGIHYRSDIVAGLALGRAVAQKVVDRMTHDGADPAQ